MQESAAEIEAMPGMMTTHEEVMRAIEARIA